MSISYRPTGAVYVVNSSDSLDGLDFDAGDFPNTVLVTNTDTGNAVVVSVQADIAGTYAAYPVLGTNYVGYGVLVQPSTAVLVAVNSTFAAGGPGTQMAATAVCATGETATVLFSSGSFE